MKLLLVDPHVVTRSPAMRSWIQALPKFRDLFDEIEIWATECDVADQPGITWRKIPQRFPTWTLHALDFEYQVRSLQSKSDTSDMVVQVTNCFLDRADIRYVHYWNRAFLEESEKRPETLKLSFSQKMSAKWAARRELLTSQNLHSTGSWWVVSRALGKRIEQDGGGGGRFEVLPNQYDPSRFHSGIRAEQRLKMRRHYGLSETSRVFVFSAFGHFERKGLLQAVESLSLLKEKGYDVKLLILGGQPNTIDAFRKKLSLKGLAADFCIFAGLVSDIQNHLCAADALLFPSHFEAFSLAEIEAAALGLRLYLTPHYGTEMILREPENGRFLPWDVAGMAKILEEELQEERIGKSHHQLGEALSPRQYAERLRLLYQKAIAMKMNQEVPS